jgi:hypothetical protein
MDGKLMLTEKEILLSNVPFIVFDIERLLR